MQLIDESAIIWSAPESERAGRPLLVLLHGYGSHEGDLFGLSPHLPLQPVIASVRAPLRAGPGYAWYGLEWATPESRSDGANAAARGLLENTELTPSEIVKKSLTIAGDICIYTNQNHIIETLD